MAKVDETVRMYQEVATRYDKAGDSPMRDRFWVLAADAMFAAGRKDDAEKLRLWLLHVNPHHLLRPYANFAEAMRSGDVRKYRRASPQLPSRDRGQTAGIVAWGEKRAKREAVESAFRETATRAQPSYDAGARERAGHLLVSGRKVALGRAQRRW